MYDARVVGERHRTDSRGFKLKEGDGGGGERGGGGAGIGQISIKLGLYMQSFDTIKIVRGLLSKSAP